MSTFHVMHEVPARAGTPNYISQRHSVRDRERQFEDIGVEEDAGLLRPEDDAMKTVASEGVVEALETPFEGKRFFGWFTLWRANLIALILHTVAIALWFILRFTLDDRTLKLPVVTSRVEFNITKAGDPIPFSNPPTVATDEIATGVYEVEERYRIDVYLYAVWFSAVSAIAHATALIFYKSLYLGNLARGRNVIQWTEYSISASIMTVAIAHLTGIFDVEIHILLAFLTAAVMIFGLVQEELNPLNAQTGKFINRKVRWWPFFIGFVFFVPAWVFIFWHIAREDSVPDFVYAVVISQSLLFLEFPLITWLHYKGFLVRRHDSNEPYLNARSYGRAQLLFQFASWQAKFVLPAIVMFGSLREMGPICYANCGV